MSRPFDDRYQLRMRETIPYPLTAQLCVAIDAETLTYWDERTRLTITAESVAQIDREREIAGIPTIFR